MTTPTSTSNRERAPGPGALLAQARRDLQLGPEEAAAKLHLSTRQIQALENDDYQALPGPTYVRGYLKSYAMLLGIDPAPVLEAHAQLTAKPSAAPDFSTIAPQREITSRHHQVRIVTYLVAAVVIGLAIVWWQGRSTPTSSTLAVAPVAEPAATEPPAVAADTPSAVDAAPPAPALPPTAAPAVTTRAAPAAVPARPPVAAPPESESLPEGPRGTLVLHAEQDTWADVRDGRQVKLLYETVSAGRTVTLKGIAPISVFLGNAAGARVEYNGRAVDIGRYQRGMVARFVMGEEEADVAPQN
jgi:cytoskeleton protein RodZ